MLAYDCVYFEVHLLLVTDLVDFAIVINILQLHWNSPIKQQRIASH